MVDYLPDFLNRFNSYFTLVCLSLLILIDILFRWFAIIQMEDYLPDLFTHLIIIYFREPMFHVMLLIIMLCLYNSEAAAAAIVLAGPSQTSIVALNSDVDAVAASAVAAIVSAGPSQTSIAALDADVDVVAASSVAAIVSVGPSQTNFNWAASDPIVAFDAFVDANAAAAAALDAPTKPLCSARAATNQGGGGVGGGGGGNGGFCMTREEAERETRNI